MGPGGGRGRGGWRCYCTPHVCGEYHLPIGATSDPKTWHVVVLPTLQQGYTTNYEHKVPAVVTDSVG